MKKRLLLIMLMVAATFVQAAENLIINGDFSNDVSGWYGTDLATQPLSGNECLKIWLRQWDSSRLSQELQISGPYQSYSVKCRYKTSRNYIGKGVKISAVPKSREGEKPDDIRNARESFELQRTDEWTPLVYNINFESGLTNCEHILLEFETQPGRGVLYLDDIEMTGSLSRLEVIEPEPAPEKNEPKADKSKADKKIEFESLPKNNTGNLLKNGDFSDGEDHWKGHHYKKLWRIKNGILSIETNSKIERNLHCVIQAPINSHGCKKFRFRCRYKTSEDYTSENSHIQLYEYSQGISRKFRLPNKTTSEWTHIDWEADLSRVLKLNFKMQFAIGVGKGAGEIYFDDLELYGIP